MKTTIIMIALLVAAIFAVPMIMAQGSAVSTVPTRISDLGHKNPGLKGDLNGDGLVNDTDLQLLLGAWGQCFLVSADSNCFADLDNDGTVGASDLLILLGNWYNPDRPVVSEAEVDDSSDRSSVTITDVRKASGVDITVSDIDGFDTEDKFLVIAIYGSGPEVKFVLFEKRTVYTSENGEKTLHTERRYNGKLSIENEGTFIVRGPNLSNLELVRVGNDQPKAVPISVTSIINGKSHTTTVDVTVNKLADKSDIKVISTANGKVVRYIETSSDLTTTNSASNRVVGKVNFDFANKQIHTSIDGETKSYKIETLYRKPVRDIAPGQIVSDIAKERPSFLKRWFNSQRASDSSVSDEVSEYGLIEEESSLELDRAGEGLADEAGQVPSKLDNRGFLRSLFAKIFRI